MADASLPLTLQDLHEASVTVAPLPSCAGASCPAGGSYSLLRVAKPQQQALVSKQCDLWSFVWTSTSVAADLLATLMTAPAAQRLLLVEVGAGCGLASMAAARGGAAVVCSDAVEDALTLVRLNAGRNGLTVQDWNPASAGAGVDAVLTCDEKLRPGTIATRQYNWGDSEALAPIIRRALSEGCYCGSEQTSARGEGAGADGAAAAVALPCCSRSDSSCLPSSLLLVGADVLFLESNVRPILRSVRDAAALAKEAGVAWAGAVLVDPGRTPRETLEGLASDYGLVIARRWDGYSCATPYALMREVTVFVLTDGSSSSGLAGSDAPLPPLLAAMEELWFDGPASSGAEGSKGLASRCATGGAPAPSISSGSKFGYTMPAV